MTHSGARFLGVGLALLLTLPVPAVGSAIGAALALDGSAPDQGEVAAGPTDALPQEPTATAPDSTTLPNPFADFETHRLSNGVRVWFKQLQGAPNVSVSAGVAVGSDADPPGREQLAHFTEHMLFSDHDGRTEQEIKDAVEGLGGRRNGITYPDHTWYYVTIGAEHGLFAIEWLAGILSPHEMDPEVVERGRQPVENEIGARPRELLDHVQALLNPSWLSPPGFWEREFGIERRRDPNPYLWRSLNAITPEDLRGFYDRYYAPGGMTVTILGDLDPDEALAAAERTFGRFPVRPVHRWEVELADPGRSRSYFGWGYQAAVLYQSRHKLFDPTADQVLTALFVRDLLNRRLGQRLRYGERKAVYGASVNLVQRGPAKFLLLDTRIDEEDYEFAREIIDEEIQFLRNGTLDPVQFEADRAALMERLRSSNQTAESLNSWTRSYFYDPTTFADFPDVLSFYQDLTQDRIASFARVAFDESRYGLTVQRPQPVGQATLGVGAVALVWLGLTLVQRLLTKPVRMREVRYIARFRLPVVLRVAYTVGLVALLAALLMLSRFAVLRLGPWVSSVDSYAFQAVAIAAGLFAVLVLGCLIYAATPRKLLLFTDHIRIKSRAWRSRALHAEDVADISFRRFRGAWLTPRILRGLPLAFGLLKPGIHIQPVRGRSYFFRTRDTEELAEVLGEWWGGEVE